jgi:hypothetical protein
MGNRRIHGLQGKSGTIPARLDVTRNMLIQMTYALAYRL